MTKINTKVLMSGAEYFDNHDAINAYMDDNVPVDQQKAIEEHSDIQRAFKEAGIEVRIVPAPLNCQDAVYTANWALTHGNKAIMSNLPIKRQPEEPYAEKVLSELGYDIVHIPKQFPFSGQGDALPCGGYLFVGTGYRTAPEVHPILAKETGLEVISVQTVPHYDEQLQPVINPVTGWPDSFFYDLDLAISIITPTLIAWCPEAFTPESQERIHAMNDIDKIEVTIEEAMQASACNLVSTGETVIMGARAPLLRTALEKRGFKVLAPDVTELMKGGGFIRCTSLSL